ncbi:MAG: hypothetical protein KKE64_01755, partial [Candidatus Omnitrophica bacterium]|nr:hypothetical protein [Candidatus Omnitrophota bacterium]
MLNKTVRLVSFLDAMFTYKTKLANFFRVSKKEIERYYSEINTSEFLLDIHGKVGNYRNVYLFGMLNPLRAPLFYVICRIIKPEIIVETGVADGFSSSCILYALKQNKQGRLY